MELCFLFRRNAITNTDLQRIQYELDRFQELRTIFIETGVRADISLPRQHALQHYHYSIMLFGSPNGLCSSITESKHIVAVKEPWRRSSRYKALSQMLRTLSRLDKLAALRQIYVQRGMMVGKTSAYVAQSHNDVPGPMVLDDEDSDGLGGAEGDDNTDDVGPVPGPRALSPVKLATQIRMLMLALFDQTLY